MGYARGLISNRAEDRCRRVPLIAFLTRARAAFGPQACQCAFLPNPCLILEPELNGFVFSSPDDVLWDGCIVPPTLPDYSDASSPLMSADPCLLKCWQSLNEQNHSRTGIGINRPRLQRMAPLLDALNGAEASSILMRTKVSS